MRNNFSSTNVIERNNNELSIPLNQLKTGVYFVNIITDGVSGINYYYEKIMVVK